MADEIKNVIRLHPEELRKLRKQLGGEGIDHVNDKTTPLQAGFQLGINRVLNVLQEGFTITLATPGTTRLVTDKTGT